MLIIGKCYKIKRKIRKIGKKIRSFNKNSVVYSYHNSNILCFSDKNKRKLSKSYDIDRKIEECGMSTIFDVAEVLPHLLVMYEKPTHY